MTAALGSHDFKTLARMGYSARGIVYLVIGGLALLTAFGQGGEMTDSKGAIMTIMQQPFGTGLLVLLVIGLFGYVVWRLVQAVQDPDDHGTSAKGLAVRAGLFVSAITHALLALWTIKLILGESSDDKSASTQSFIASEIGQIVVGLIGVAMVCVGCAHLFKGWTARFERYMSIPADKALWMRPLCQFGLMARGIVWCILGWFFIRSAFQAGAEEIKGLADAMAALRNSSYGVWLFGIVAAGLFAFGLYSMLEAAYRRINIKS